MSAVTKLIPNFVNGPRTTISTSTFIMGYITMLLELRRRNIRKAMVFELQTLSAKFRLPYSVVQHSANTAWQVTEMMIQ